MYNNYGPPQQPYDPAPQYRVPPYETQGYPQQKESLYSPPAKQPYNAQQPYPQQPPYGQTSPYGSPPPLHSYNPPSQPTYDPQLQAHSSQAYHEKPPHDPLNAQPQVLNEKHQYNSPPNHLDPSVANQPNAPQQQPITFYFSGIAREKSMLDTTITDPWGRLVLTVSSPSKKQSVALDGERRVVATFDWDHSSPVMVYRGQTTKTREWLPYQKKPTKCFVMHHNGQTFNWTDVPNGDTILCHESAPGRPLAISPELPGGKVQVQVLPEALSQGMLEPILLAIFLMACKKGFGDAGGSSGMIGAGIAAFMFL